LMIHKVKIQGERFSQRSQIFQVMQYRLLLNVPRIENQLTSYNHRLCPDWMK
jgi:hypothetical protein